MKQRTSEKYCPVCGFKKRGSEHNNGQHHKEAEAKLNKAGK